MMHSVHSGPRSAQLLSVLIVATLLTLLTVASPSAAGGTAFTAENWAGIRAWEWNHNATWRLPTRVTAQWQVPCLNPADTRYGAYDQWIGIEGSQGTLIQVGVRPYHVATGFGVFTGYFAWVVDTRDAAVRTPYQVFTIVRCGFGDTQPIVNAEVNADGRVQIRVVNNGGVGQSNSYGATWSSITYPETPRFGTFVLERFTSVATNTLPFFGRAGFQQAWVGSGNSGWYLNTAQDYVRSKPHSMLSLIQGPFGIRLPAVITNSPNIYGDFTFDQWFTQ